MAKTSGKRKWKSTPPIPANGKTFSFLPNICNAVMNLCLTVAGETRVACVKFGVDSESMLLFVL